MTAQLDRPGPVAVGPWGRGEAGGTFGPVAVPAEGPTMTPDACWKGTMTEDDGGEPGARRCPLADGRVLTVRRARPGDDAGLRDLYAGLSDEDRRRRFFSYFRPPDEFFEAKTSLDDPSRYALVATVSGEGIVGEASYALVPSGDAELAITIAPRWRGWLGHYLLDALIEAAAAQGIPNLQAEILWDNQPMLSLVRARGYATRVQDPGTLRVVIGTTGSMPTWPGADDRGRVLVEGGSRSRGALAAKDAGLDVMICPGPMRRAGRPSCPVLEGKRCPLADGADVVVFALDSGRTPEAARILDAHLRERPGRVAVDVAAQRDRGRSLPTAVVRFPAGMTADEIAATLEELAGEKGTGRICAVEPVAG